jgi:hypothetical protein
MLYVSVEKNSNNKFLIAYMLRKIKTIFLWQLLGNKNHKSLQKLINLVTLLHEIFISFHIGIGNREIDFYVITGIN